MQTREAREQETADAEERVTDAAGNERRRAFRRKLPFGRGAVLVVGGRAHIVGVADLSVTGAYLSTRAPVSVGDTHMLRLLLLPDTVEVELQAEIVRVAQVDVESPDHPRGVAVRFLGAGERAMGRLRTFIGRAQGGKS
jgi:NAD(P)H-hydrate repair Nnr-like enzyme with NAD(P)H-hydrate dehydratase domain